jgi:hypothetical protein
VPGRQRDDQLSVKDSQPTRRHDQAAIRPAREGRHAALDFATSGASATNSAAYLRMRSASPAWWSDPALAPTPVSAIFIAKVVNCP